jgi:RNA polymerase sigma-70 factor, ECF subfamily
MRVLEAGLLDEDGSPPSAGPGVATRDDQRITGIVREHYGFVWRLLLRLGVPASAAQDAAQQVFVVATRRVAEINLGSEKSFLFGTALRVASDERRLAKHREVPAELPDTVDLRSDPEQQLHARRQRGVLQELLLAMPLELRTVFVLFELEQMTKTEVAELLGVPVGTAVSRLRRARELFREVLSQRGLSRSGEP